MHIGTRKIRSAGRASGSIEITLPPELASLEGVDCRILLRDGARPEVVLEPNLAPAVVVFAQVWARLRSLLSLAGDIGEFPGQELDVVLLPTQRPDPEGAFGSGRPALAYSQAWQVSQGANSERSGAALAGVVTPLATVAGQRLGLSGVVAATFGAALAWLALPAGPQRAADAESFEHGVARRIWLETYGPSAPPLGVLVPQGDEPQARQALQRIISQFRRWQERPDQHELARARWGPVWSAGVTVSTLEDFVAQRASR
jgi:hypothetical protein